MQKVHDMFWGGNPIFDSNPDQLGSGKAIPNLEAIDASVAPLNPETSLQKQARDCFVFRQPRSSRA
jgi:hypothetical protein